jgi:hypothetical protein
LTTDDVVGKWRLVSVDLDGRTMSVHRLRPIRAVFEPSGTFVVSDGANMSSGRYSLRENVVTFGQVRRPLIGYFPEDAALQAVVEAVHRTMRGDTRVEINVVGETLQVTAASHRLTYRRL